MAHAGLKTVGERQHGLAPLGLYAGSIGVAFASQCLLPVEFAAFRFEGGRAPLVDFMRIGPENLHRAGHIANLVGPIGIGHLDRTISGSQRAHPFRHSHNGSSDEPLRQCAGKQCHGDAGRRREQGNRDRAERRRLCGQRRATLRVFDRAVRCDRNSSQGPAQ